MKIIAITPKLFDYLVSAIIEGLYKNNVEIIALEPSNNVKKVYSKKEMIEHSKDADYILVFRGKAKGNIPPKYFLLDKINKPHLTAFIDGSEWNFSGYPEKNQVRKSLIDPKRRKGKKWINKNLFKYCRWYFKRECYPEDAKKGIIPLLYAAEDRYFGNYDFEKNIDVLCTFGQNVTGLRKDVEEVCKKLKDEGYKIIIKGDLEYKNYKKLIASSYICIDAWGSGDCTARFWEIIANKSCCFSQKYNILFPKSFTDGYNYVEYSNIEEFEDKLRFYLKNKNKCLEIAEKGYQHLLKYHISKQRAKYLLEILQKKETRIDNYPKKSLITGKKVYLGVILTSFIRKPKNIFIYLISLIKEIPSKFRTR
ncbi:MAG: glycosyltransferase [Promethearchaeota archaeon]